MWSLSHILCLPVYYTPLKMWKLILAYMAIQKQAVGPQFASSCSTFMGNYDAGIWVIDTLFQQLMTYPCLLTYIRYKRKMMEFPWIFIKGLILTGKQMGLPTKESQGIFGWLNWVTDLIWLPFLKFSQILGLIQRLANRACMLLVFV